MFRDDFLYDGLCAALFTCDELCNHDFGFAAGVFVPRDFNDAGLAFREVLVDADVGATC
jgi:hypothetical protein